MGNEFVSDIFYGETSGPVTVESQQDVEQILMAGTYRVVDGQLFRITDELPELLRNTVDLDPRINKLIDDHFWELF